MLPFPIISDWKELKVNIKMRTKFNKRAHSNFEKPGPK